MPETIDWDDAGEIAQLLAERFPDTDPGVVSDLELTRWVRELPGLSQPDPRHPDANVPPPEQLPARLDAIRAAWLQERRRSA